MSVSDSEVAVDAEHLAGSVEVLALGEDRTDERLRVEVVADPPDERLRRLRERHVGGGVGGGARRFVVGVQHADGCPARFPGQLPAELRVDNRARVDGSERRLNLEDLGAFPGRMGAVRGRRG